MPSSVEYLYGALGLQPPVAFAAAALREQRQQPDPAYVGRQAGRRTGRTTNELLKCIAQLLHGRKVGYVVHNDAMKRYAKDMVRTWLRQLGHDDKLQNLVVVVNRKRAKDCAKVYVDHAVGKGA